MDGVGELDFPRHSVHIQAPIWDSRCSWSARIGHLPHLRSCPDVVVTLVTIVEGVDIAKRTNLAGAPHADTVTACPVSIHIVTAKTDGDRPTLRELIVHPLPSGVQTFPCANPAPKIDRACIARRTTIANRGRIGTLVTEDRRGIGLCQSQVAKEPSDSSLALS